MVVRESSRTQLWRAPHRGNHNQTACGSSTASEPRTRPALTREPAFWLDTPRIPRRTRAAPASSRRPRSKANDAVVTVLGHSQRQETQDAGSISERTSTRAAVTRDRKTKIARSLSAPTSRAQTLQVGSTLARISWSTLEHARKVIPRRVALTARDCPYFVRDMVNHTVFVQCPTARSHDCCVTTCAAGSGGDKPSHHDQPLSWELVFFFPMKGKRARFRPFFCGRASLFSIIP